MKFTNSRTLLAVAAVFLSMGASAQTAPRGTSPVPRPAIKPAPAPKVMRTPAQMLQMQINNRTLPSGFVIPQGFVGSLPPGYRVP